MLPRLATPPAIQTQHATFIERLAASPFSGDIHLDYASRLAHATDNSVYQLVPDAVVHPRSHRDVVILACLASRPEFQEVRLSARGGGTGTNGQSLSTGIVVDLSRHMNRVVAVDYEQGWVRVQPGVVLDQLNQQLAPHGYFFAPTLSPSNRATLGGMISTDACGKGSRLYGKTSDHVRELTVVFADGTEWQSKPVERDAVRELSRRSDCLGRAVRTVDRVVAEKAELIRERFPDVPRFLTGYDLAHVVDAEGRFNLNSVIAGSEGTLVFITEATLGIVPLPTHKRLVAIRYASFDDALKSAQTLVETSPGAIETIDERIVELARDDAIWHRVGHLLDDPSGATTRAINLVEYEGDDEQAVAGRFEALLTQLRAHQGQPGQPIGYVVPGSRLDAQSLWELRKKGVGLLGAAPGRRRPVAFVEDTAVPPEHLADYIRDFRGLLEAEGLQYGMFGHVDVGCLHVRPALDLKDPADELRLRRISDRVVELVKRYGGVMWAEHGKGFRSEYSPQFFGKELFSELCRIKGAFDPHNQLNPGKLAIPWGSATTLVSVDADKRGQYDRQIAPSSLLRFANAVHCNGNGACFDFDPDSVMCPSSRVTRDRVHSPKGRAALMREWLRQLSTVGVDAAVELERRAGDGSSTLAGAASKRRGEYDFSHEVYDGMSGCLSCKACATQCPVKVDVPAMKSEFLELYHRRYPRPVRDYLLAALEFVLVGLALVPRLTNALLAVGWVRRFMRGVVGLIDIPALAELTLSRGLRRRRAPRFSAAAIGGLAPAQRERAVLLVQDAFTSFYESKVVLATYDLLLALGYLPYVLPYRPNGKGLHVKGFLRWFRLLAERNGRWLRDVSGLGVPLVGIDPAVTLTYRDEYTALLGASSVPTVMLLQEWLSASLASRAPESLDGLRVEGNDREPYILMPHCTEQTAAPRSQDQWRKVFEALGLRLKVADLGCCGMCGVYGHEAEHETESREIYAMSWQRALPSEPSERQRYLAAGHSCRSQVERQSQTKLRHPAEALLGELRAAGRGRDSGSRGLA